MSFVYWVPNAGGDWDAASNWSGGVKPASSDVVTISTSTVQTITHVSGKDTVASLSVGNDLLDVTGGSLTVLGAASMASGFAISGGVFSVGTSATIMGNLAQTGGTLLVANSLTLSGSAILQGGSLGGSTVLQTAGPIAISTYTIAGSSEISNTGLIDQSGTLTIGDRSGTGASVVNQAGAIYAFAGPSLVKSGSPTAIISNAGSMVSLTGSGTSMVGASVSSTGAVSAGAGSTILFTGAASTLAGTVGGAGIVGFAGGTTTLTSGLILNVATLSLAGTATNLILAADETTGRLYSQSDSSTLQLGGHTLTLAGRASFQHGTGTPVASGGVLSTTGKTTMGGTATALTIAGGAVWDNSGIVTASQGVQLGDSTSNAATLVNAASGTIDLAAGGISIATSAKSVGSLVNAGKLSMASGSGTSTVTVDLVSTGIVGAVQGGTLEFDGPATSLAGSITGDGQVSVGAGTATIAVGTAIDVGMFTVRGAGTGVTLDGSATASGDYSQTNGSTLSLGGNTLTIGGDAQFQQSTGSPLVLGPGTLATEGVTTLGGSTRALTLNGGAVWANDGTVLDSQGFLIGGSSTGSASVVNEADGVFVLAAGVTVGTGNQASADLINVGLLERTATGSPSALGISVSNTGTILVENGQLKVTGAVTGSGVVQISAFGTAVFTSTVQSSETVQFLDGSGELSLTLPSASAVGATISGFSAGDTIDLTNIHNATEIFKNGTLTFVGDSSHAVVATLNITGSPAFAFASDGHEGTLITTTTHSGQRPGPVPQSSGFFRPEIKQAQELGGNSRPSYRLESTMSLLDWDRGVRQPTYVDTANFGSLLYDHKPGLKLETSVNGWQTFFNHLHF